jgi:hypothetical protein
VAESGLSFTGPWKELGGALERLSDPKKMEKAFEKSLSREAHRLQGQIVQTFARQGAPGVRWAPLSQMTLELRSRRGFAGSKALLDRADLRNSIKVRKAGARDAKALGISQKPKGALTVYFVGVHRSERARNGGPLVNVAIIQEGGATIKIFGTGSATIPARPFIGPVWAAEAPKSARRIMRDFRREIFR